MLLLTGEGAAISFGAGGSGPFREIARNDHDLQAGPFVDHLMTTTGRGRSHMRVMVVDDDAHVRDLVRLEISLDDRFEVCAEAPNGLVAVEMAMLHSPDAVILDHRMPMLDGLAALRMICRAVPHATVVVFSSCTDPATADAALQLGAAKFFSKDRSSVDEVLSFLGQVQHV